VADATPTFDDLAKFKFNVDGKLDSTRGLFVAMAGFDENTLDHLFKVARGLRNNLVLVDGQDLTRESGLPGEGAVVEPLPRTGGGRGSLTDLGSDRPL
jgi:hypothetical protein